MFAVLSSARKAITRTAFAVSALALTACDDVAIPSGGGSGGPSIDTSKPVPVALLLPKSDAGAGGVARSLEAAARLAVADLQDVKIDLRVYDTAGSEAQAAAQAQAAVDAGAKIILGPLFAGNAVTASKAVADEGVNVLAFSNNTDIAGGNLFVLGDTFENYANRLVGYAKRNGKSRAVIVHPATVEGEFGKRAFQTAAARSGLTVTGVQPFEFTEQGAISVVSAVRNGINQTNADTVLISAASAGALPLLLQLMPEGGVNPATTQYVGLLPWADPRLHSLRGAEGGWFAMPDTSAQANFDARYQEAYGTAPHRLAGLAFDGIAAIGALAKAGNSNALAKSGLTQSAGFQGVNGVFRLRPDGKNERALAIATIRDKRVVILDPAPRSFAGAGF